MGKFRVSLPYNNPLYSFVLYSCGIALSGNEVIVRASKLTESYVHEFFDKYRVFFTSLGIKLFYGTGNDFISDAVMQIDSGGLLFAGAYENVSSIMKNFPRNQRLIYCGPGINPFIVGAEESNISQVVALAVASRTYNSGQDCLCSERFFVHENVYDQFCAELIEQVKKLRVGNFGDRSADIFPPIRGVQQYTNECLQMIRRLGTPLFIHKNDLGVALAVFGVELDSDALNYEKLCSVFTIAKYRS